MAKIRKSEYRSYAWIKSELQNAGWNTRNPATDSAGEVYYQQECLNHPEIKRVLGQQRPEFVIKLNEADYWIIEAKADVADIDKAFREAVEYGEEMNISSLISARIVTGIAGTEATEMSVRTAFLENGEYKEVTYNGERITSILTKEKARQLLEGQTAKLRDLIPDERMLLSVAEDINEVLHNGSINKEARSKVVSAIILAMIESGELDIRSDCQVFIDSINSKARQVLKNYKKENFFDSIRLYLPERENAQKKYKEALIKTYHLLKKIDIKAAMYSGTDVLGKFYEVFLKYGNGAKDIGIVLTPRHITKFACEVLGIQYTDIVYDPTCGTGGFLVAAFDYVREHATQEQTKIFKEHHIFGIEQDPTVATMAIINMIFRGDGKSNIINEDCFPMRLQNKVLEGVETAEYIDAAELLVDAEKCNEGPVTKVLMNPPFSKSSENEKAYQFIQYALEQMQTGGILFSVIPTSVMIKGGKLKKWRQKMLQENTLLAVIDFPEDLFYPVGTRTVGVFVKRGIAHNYEKDRVLWGKVQCDGFAKSKGKRLLDDRIPNELQELQSYLKMHLYDTTVVKQNIPERLKVCLLDSMDENVELMPEVYLDEELDTAEGLFEQAEEYVREYLSFLIRHGVKLTLNGEKELKSQKTLQVEAYKEFALKDFLRKDVSSGSVHSISEISEGEMPLISCKTEDNGIIGNYDVEIENCTEHCFTIAGDGSFPVTTYYHYNAISSYDNVTIAPLRRELSLETIFFLASRLNRSRWRYSYGRKCYAKKVRELTIMLPVDKSGEMDEALIKEMFGQMYGWKEIVSYIETRKL